MRFESVLCLPVWSFNGPSRQDGVVLVRFANLYWLVTVSGFQGSSCGGFPAYPAVLPAASRQTCVRRQGDTLRIRLHRVNSFSKLSFGPCQVRNLASHLEIRNALRVIRKASAAQHVGRVAAAFSLLCDRLRTAFCFQHALRSLT